MTERKNKIRPQESSRESMMMVILFFRLPNEKFIENIQERVQFVQLFLRAQQTCHCKLQQQTGVLV